MTAHRAVIFCLVTVQLYRYQRTVIHIINKRAAVTYSIRAVVGKRKAEIMAEKIILDASYYEYKCKNDYFKVLMKDIMYFKSEKRVIKIYLCDGSIKTYYDKLNSVEEKIKTKKLDFWRIHQSILVNTKYIVRKAYDHVELTDATKLYISEDRRKIINEIYAKTIEGEMSE